MNDLRCILHGSSLHLRLLRARLAWHTLHRCRQPCNLGPQRLHSIFRLTKAPRLLRFHRFRRVKNHIRLPLRAVMLTHASRGRKARVSSGPRRLWGSWGPRRLCCSITPSWASPALGWTTATIASRFWHLRELRSDSFRSQFTAEARHVVVALADML